MAEHIDRSRLSTDINYRFKYVSKFVDFTQNDIKVLNTIAPIICPLLPKMIEKVYKKLYAYDITKAYFMVRNDGFENFSPNKAVGVTLDSVQVDYRKDMLSIFLTRVLTQTEWNDSFLEYLSRVGEMHTSKGGSASINVDYIHINALLCVLERLFIDAIWDMDNLESKYKREVLTALNKFFWIQNDVFTMQYGLSLREKQISLVPKIDFSKCFFR